MAEPQRTVMLRPGYSVPGVPQDMLRAVYGERTADPRVEFVALTVEYYVDAHATRPLTLSRVLEAMRGRITSDNVWDLVSLLAKRGLAEDFFGLAARDVDRDGAFRSFLTGLDPVLGDAVRHYSAWHAIDPRAFMDGFAVGVAESFATVVVDLAQLVKLIGRLQYEQFTTLYVLATDPAAGIERLDGQASAVRQAFSGIVAALGPAELPAKVVQVWRGWETEFEKHLEALDPFAAGKVLGRIAGDLWQLLSGLGALSKLLRAGVRQAVRYGPLLVGVLRGAAAQVALLTRELAALLRAIGKAVLAAAPRVGMEFLRTLFPPELLRPLFEKGRVFLTHQGLSLTLVFQGAHAEAFAGAGAGTGLGVLVSQDSKPLCMAATSETVSSLGRPATRAELDAALDEILAGLDKAFARHTKRAGAVNTSEAVVKAAAAAQLEQRLTTHFNALLQRVAYDAFRELRKAGRVDPGELGRLIHERMRTEVARLAAKASPGLKVYTEHTLGTVARAVLGSSPELDAALKATVAQLLLKHRDRELLLKLVGFDAGAAGAAAADTEQALARHLSNRFGWRTGTTVGDLRSDLLLVDPGAARVTNVDWRSSTYLEKFEQVWGRVADDLGGTFDGKWEAVAEAYRRAGKGGVPAEVVRELERLTTHAVRETVVRQAALQSVFGELWFVTSHEMIYKGLHAMFKSSAKSAVK